MSAAAAGRIVHHVWFKFKADASAEAVKKVFDELLALKGKVPAILEISVGKNFTERAKGFTHGLTVIVPNGQLAAYADHPEHQRVLKDFILPIKEDVMALDYVEGEY